MAPFKNLLFLFSLAVLATIFTTNNAAAQSATRVRQPAAVFTAVDSSEVWIVAKMPSVLPDGKHVLATHKKNRTQIILVARGGKIAQVGHQAPGAAFKALPANATPCISGGFCTTYQARVCYTSPWGSCICVCGGFITTGN